MDDKGKSWPPLRSIVCTVFIQQGSWGLYCMSTAVQVGCERNGSGRVPARLAAVPQLAFHRTQQTSWNEERVLLSPATQSATARTMRGCGDANKLVSGKQAGLAPTKGNVLHQEGQGLAFLVLHSIVGLRIIPLLESYSSDR